MNKDIIGLHTKKRFAFNNTLILLDLIPDIIYKKDALYMNLIQRNSKPKEEWEFVFAIDCHAIINWKGKWEKISPGEIWIMLPFFVDFFPPGFYINRNWWDINSVGSVIIWPLVAV
jgi:hypothetical protein